MGRPWRCRMEIVCDHLLWTEAERHRERDIGRGKKAAGHARRTSERGKVDRHPRRGTKQTPLRQRQPAPLPTHPTPTASSKPLATTSACPSLPNHHGLLPNIHPSALHHVVGPSPVPTRDPTRETRLLPTHTVEVSICTVIDETHRVLHEPAVRSLNTNLVEGYAYVSCSAKDFLPRFYREPRYSGPRQIGTPLLDVDEGTG